MVMFPKEEPERVVVFGDSQQWQIVEQEGYNGRPKLYIGRRFVGGRWRDECFHYRRQTVEKLILIADGVAKARRRGS